MPWAIQVTRWAISVQQRSKPRYSQSQPVHSTYGEPLWTRRRFDVEGYASWAVVRFAWAKMHYILYTATKLRSAEWSREGLPPVSGMRTNRPMWPDGMSEGSETKLYYVSSTFNTAAAVIACQCFNANCATNATRKMRSIPAPARCEGSGVNIVSVASIAFNLILVRSRLIEHGNNEERSQSS